jgi:pyruvate dehydrogenase E2 component (dihydrolipoamide acetyltransferase)
VPSPERGRITEITVKEGQTVRVGEVLARLQTDGELEPGLQPRKEPPKEPQVAAEVAEEPVTPPPPQEVERNHVAQPPPAGKQRITPEGGGATEAGVPRERAEPEKPVSAVPVAAAPSVRQLARELGIDINKVPGSGPGGRITQEDVKQYARQIIGGRTVPARALGGAPVGETVRPLPDLSPWGDIERRPMSRTRRTIADTLSYGWSHIPHVTQYDRADITD